MNWLITNFISAFLLPPLNFLMLFAIGGGLLYTTYAHIGRWLIWIAIATLYIFSTPLFGNALLAAVEQTYSQPNLDQAQAIVVLGGGVYHDAPEYGGDTVRSYTLERLRYAARLQRASALPVLTSGGSPEGGEPEAIAMWNTLRKDFNIETRWVEITSMNSVESARHSYAILAPFGITRIMLVTHAWHMPRAKAVFEKAGFSVIPAATIFAVDRKPTPLDILPSTTGLLSSRMALHEMIGMLWYRLTGAG